MKNEFLESNLSLRLLVKDSVLYGMVAGFTKATAFLLVPLFTRALSPANFGVLDTLLLISNLFLLMGNGGIDSALMYFFYQTDQQGRSRLVATGLWSRFLLGCLVTLVAVLFSNNLSHTAFRTTDHTYWLLLAVLIIPLTLSVTYGLDLLRIERRRTPFFALSSFRLVLLIVGTWYTLSAFPENPVEAFLIYRVLAEGLVAVLIIATISLEYNLRNFSGEVAGSLIRYGMPLVPAAFLFWTLGFVDRWFLFRTISGDEVGVYALAVKIGLGLALFGTAVQMAFNPFSMAVRDDERSVSFFRRAFILAMWSATVVVMFVVANLNPVISLVAGPGYMGAAVPAAFLLLANLWYIAFVFFTTGANIRRKTIYHFYSYLVAVSTAVALNWTLIPFWRSTGAACAIMLSGIALAATGYGLSQRVHPLQFDIGRFAAGMGLCSVLSIGMALLEPTSESWDLIVRNGVALLGAFLIGITVLRKEYAIYLLRRLFQFRFSEG